MKTMFYVLLMASLAPANLALAADEAENPVTAADPEAPERARALSAARSLCPGYFAKHYQTIGEELRCSLNFNEPASIDGWPGRWRIRGVATLSHYRDPAVDPSLVAREAAIRNNKSLSSRQVDQQIDRLYFVRSEAVEFDVEVSNLDSSPEIDVTLR